MYSSPWLNLSLYPDEADYQRARPLGDSWQNLQTSVRATDAPWELPPQLAEREGPLVYLSLGSLGSADVDLMQKLVDSLAEAPFRVIVSKGPQHELLRLPDTMAGEEFLPQTSILPQVDAVITHGGNNTVTECFHFGKPMVVLPLFWDQYDNAQRVQETGYGLRLDTYGHDPEELTGAVDRVLRRHRGAMRARLAARAPRGSQAHRGHRARRGADRGGRGGGGATWRAAALGRRAASAVCAHRPSARPVLVGGHDPARPQSRRRRRPGGGSGSPASRRHVNRERAAPPPRAAPHSLPRPRRAARTRARSCGLVRRRPPAVAARRCAARSARELGRAVSSPKVADRAREHLGLVELLDRRGDHFAPAPAGVRALATGADRCAAEQPAGREHAPDTAG